MRKDKAQFLYTLCDKPDSITGMLDLVTVTPSTFGMRGCLMALPRIDCLRSLLNSY